jgi:hypothetical protein
MAINNIAVFGTFDPAKRDGLVANQSIAGFASQDPTSQAALLQGSLAPIGYDLRATFGTTDATANEIAISLTARGMVIGSGLARALIADVYCRLAASLTDMGWVRVVGYVFNNGTNPILVGSAQNIDLESGTLTTAAAAFFINTTPTPDEVTLAVTGVAATAINWDARIYIGPLVTLA